MFPGTNEGPACDRDAHVFTPPPRYRRSRRCRRPPGPRPGPGSGDRRWQHPSGLFSPGAAARHRGRQAAERGPQRQSASPVRGRLFQAVTTGAATVVVACPDTAIGHRDRRMAFTIAHLTGETESDPPLDAIAQLMDELVAADGEHTDVGVSHESGWTLGAFPSGRLIWEHVEDEGIAPRHLPRVGRADVIRRRVVARPGRPRGRPFGRPTRTRLHANVLRVDVSAATMPVPC